MHRLLFNLFFLLSICIGYIHAQSPAAFNYQGVAREGNELITEDLDLRLSLRKDSASGPVVFQETFIGISPNPQGQFSVKWGLQKPGLDTINWSEGPYFQQVEIQTSSTGGFVDMGTTQLLTVPYSMFSGQSGDNYWEKSDSNIKYMDGSVQIGETPNTKESDLFLNGQLFVGSNAGSLTLSSGKDTGHVYINFFSNGPNNSRTAYLGFPSDGSRTFRIENQYSGPIELIPGNKLTRNNGKLELIGNGTSMRLLSGINNGHVFLAFHNNGGATSDRSAYMGYASNGSRDFRIENEEVNGRIRFNNNKLVIDKNGNVGIGTLTPSKKLEVKGSIKTQTLEITGSDIIEKAHSFQDLKPGEVLVIDPANPNHVWRSTRAYDPKVIGVVSGAGGVKHGMELSQPGVLDGNVPFAIAGRVYVRVAGKVEPGDLLTTSHIPGKAMKAKNRRKREGAVIGKALTSPNEEEMVLMLVINQ